MNFDAGEVEVELADAAAVFQAERRRLFGLAYRLLGSASDAEDAVATAFERWIAAGGAVAAPAAWLTTVVTHLCLKQLGSVRQVRERYIGTWLPEPVVTSDGALGPMETVEQRDSVSFAMLVLLERLAPPERAVFVLREAFGYSYAEIAQILTRSEAGCRQLHRRARMRLSQPERRFPADRRLQARLTEQFLNAAAGLDVPGLEQLLARDAQCTSDGAGSGLQFARKPVLGGPRIAMFFNRVISRDLADPRFTDAKAMMAELNGQPAVLVRDGGGLLSAVLLDTDGPAITAVWLIMAPAKLAFADRQTAALSRNTGSGPQ
jgi:RNA polymerase sigma factor (sigma-70 family)